MAVTIVDQETLHLAAIRVEGTFQELGERVPSAWLQLRERLPQLSRVRYEGLYYGVAPEATHTGGLGPVLTYWVGVAVQPDDPLPEGLERLTVPGGMYAQVTARGQRADIGDAYRELVRWLVETGRKTDTGRFAVEIYDNNRRSPFPPYADFDFDVRRPLPPSDG